MSTRTRKNSIDSWTGVAIPRGEFSDVYLPISESYSGISLKIPIRIQRAPKDGPVVFITAALHGDELNGTGAVRELICDDSVQLLRGALILVPILNLLAFDRHSRYLPDRRDLNRYFPGTTGGSVASRIARQVFDEIVDRSDMGIDLHTAASRRTNYPNVRADLSDPIVRQMSQDFGCEVVVNSKGPDGSLRREATKAGCPTIVMEGGEVCKVEPAIVATAVRGIKNVLRAHDMIDGKIQQQEARVVIEKAKWVRAERGGFLQFHVRPGELVEQGQPLATNTSLLGHETSLLIAPFSGVIIGMTTLPAVSPGEPVCHVGRLPRDTKASEIEVSRSETQSLENQTVTDLASNVLVVEHEESETEATDDKSSQL
ncbi:MAG: succinylglutamate desuccinylase/aspartoacylase family protein [Rubripirellula sp.]